MKYIFILIIFLSSTKIRSQDTLNARRVLDKLTSSDFFGRGYTKNGLSKSEKFLEHEFSQVGLKPMKGNSYLQPLSFPVNTFPGRMEVKINDKLLRPGYDYIVDAGSRKLKGRFILEKSDSTHFHTPEAKLSISVSEKLTWKVSRKESDSSGIIVLKKSLQETPSTISLKIKNRFIKKFDTANICGMVRGTISPDTFIIFSAHYDHLGGMGKKTFFPGANDNASGVSLLLGLADWYAKNPSGYSIGFICFTGEEAGLMGSEYFTNNPLIPLGSIRFLINLDLTGTGIEGITVVNATEFKNEFDLLKSINDKEHFFTAINTRGKAKNSDHYWFTEKGVPSFFIYTLGGIKAYHDVYDISTTLPNDHFPQLFSLLRSFVSHL